jgi:Ca-activated chloride channel family protein
MGGVIYGVGMNGQLTLPGGLALPGSDGVEITVASSVTKSRWLTEAVARFAEADIRTDTGQPITITTSNVLSGDSMLQIAAGTLQPTVWSPGEAAWVDQLNERWDRAHPTPITSADCAPTVLTPVGLAMWQPMAEALGWPDAPISLQKLIDLANDPDGWATYGHPEWGRLRLGHTHPQYSSAGLLFLTSVIYAITGKTEGITPDDIYAPEVEDGLRVLAQNTSKYGMVTTDLLNSMAANGPSFLHATSAFEEGTVRMNLEQAENLRWPLAFIFPEEGTFWSDHPFCILDQSGWVEPEQADAARKFLDFLRGDAMQAAAGDFFVRPLSPQTPLGPALSAANGTDPAASPATVPDFAIPSPDVSEAIIDQFLTTKRKATVILVLDVSGSMQGEPINTATRATAAFLDRLDPRDRVGILAFNASVFDISAIREVSDVGERAQGAVLGLIADGGTNMNGAVCRATQIMDEEMQRDRAAGENRLYGIVLLSDGEDTAGEVSETRMFQSCLRTGAEGDGARVFAIAFGNGADQEVLQRLTQETQGTLFTADPASIDAAYLKISAEQ